MTTVRETFYLIVLVAFEACRMVWAGVRWCWRKRWPVYGVAALVAGLVLLLCSGCGEQPTKEQGLQLREQAREARQQLADAYSLPAGEARDRAVAAANARLDALEAENKRLGEQAAYYQTAYGYAGTGAGLAAAFVPVLGGVAWWLRSKAKESEEAAGIFAQNAELFKSRLEPADYAATMPEVQKSHRGKERSVQRVLSTVHPIPKRGAA